LEKAEQEWVMLKSIKFEKFTAFDKLDVKFSPSINIFIGENGTGKTHILKAAYAACAITKTQGDFAQKLNNVFYPSGKQIGRLIKRSSVSTTGFVEAIREINGKTAGIKLSFSSHTIKTDKASLTGATKIWVDYPIETAYIPVKDMMANSPGFSSLYDAREIHFEEIYVDIIRKAFLPVLKGPTDKERKRLLEILQKAMQGKVVIENEEFFLRNEQGKLEFTLLAEGYRKLGLLWVLLQNGTLTNGSALFWDEPETNLNPKLMQQVVNILLELQRIGVQVFLATHDYVLLKEFDLQSKNEDKVVFHSIFRNENGAIAISSASNYLDINPNAIDDTFGGFIDREIEKSMGRLGKK
jgi:energy-coupling factor transporter ATP-binding protein EcfA2